VRSLIEVLDARERFWVNSPQPKRRADRKAAQLLHARAVGFTIPDTLLSNDPERIRDFFRSHGERVIYKPYLPATWAAEGRMYSTFTAALSEELLANDGALSQAPGIYQSMVEKQYELRVTVMGRSVFASRIDSQKDGYYLADWRANIRDQGFASKRHPLPPQIEQRCIDLLKRMGLVFGCIDIIVTPEGEHVFLEVNEMGQFLWLETEDPELPLLDCFVQFLHRRSADFRYEPGKAVCSLSEFMASDALADEPPENSSLHVPLPNSFLMQE
jgi:glutathione synthase/RimK-type ligase-like ATP-grasp enzyme